METIAPLAKVLAEANGIEWRSLHGTGDAGLITEQDILVYLARVMSGEEDAPLTPVDPEPSPAELAAYSSPELLSRAGVEADLTDFIKLQENMRDAPPLAAAPTPPTPVHTAPLPSAPEPVSTWQAPAMSVPEDAAPSAAWPSEPLQPEPLRPEPLHSEPEPVMPAASYPAASLPPVSPPAALTPALPVEDDFELDDEAASAVQGPPVPLRPEVAAQPIMQAEAAHEPAVSEPAAPPPAKSGGLLGGLLSSLYRRHDAPKAPPHKEAPHKEPAHAEPVHTEPAHTQPAHIEPPVAPLVTPDHRVPEPVSSPAVTEYPELEVAHADVVPPLAADDRPLPPAPVLGEAITPDVAAAPALPTPEVVSELPVAAPAPLPLPAVAAQPPLPAAWAGTYLRREVDLSALMDAREQLRELVGELPLSLMVARAAQRQIHLLHLSEVALADVQGQALDAEFSTDLRSSLKAAQEAQPRHHSSRQADLLVLNAGELDLDDLHYPHAVTLSLGRVQNGKAALSLNGDLDVQQAARFLAEVSALLAAPVKLLV